MPEPPTRRDLAERLFDLGHELSMTDMTAGKDHECIELCEQILATVAEYRPLVYRDMRD